MDFGWFGPKTKWKIVIKHKQPNEHLMACCRIKQPSWAIHLCDQIYIFHLFHKQQEKWKKSRSQALVNRYLFSLSKEGKKKDRASPFISFFNWKNHQSSYNFKTCMLRFLDKRMIRNFRICRRNISTMKTFKEKLGTVQTMNATSWVMV